MKVTERDMYSFDMDMGEFSEKLGIPDWQFVKNVDVNGLKIKIITESILTSDVTEKYEVKKIE